MENNIKITYPGSEKVYIKGSLRKSKSECVS